MAIIVEDTRTGARGIVLGAGHGMYQSVKPPTLFNDGREQGSDERLAVCTADGTVAWLEMAFAKVVMVDGARPNDILIDDA